MSTKFGRVKAFVNDLERIDPVGNNEVVMLIGASGCGSGFCDCEVNNCRCNGNNCACNTVFACGFQGSGGSGICMCDDPHCNCSNRYLFCS